jgi:hypothetical protein
MKNRSNNRCQVIDISFFWECQVIDVDTLHKSKLLFVRLFLVNDVRELNTLTVVLDQFKVKALVASIHGRNLS